MDPFEQFLAARGGPGRALGPGPDPFQEFLSRRPAVPPQDRSAEPPVQDDSEPTWLDTGVTMGLRIVPTVVGALGAGALATPETLGIGAIPAGMAGGAGGAALGETAAEAYEKWRGYRKGLNPTQIATQAAIGAIPVPAGGAGLKGLLGVVGKNAALGAGADIATRLAEGERPTLESVGLSAGLAAGLGTGAHYGIPALRRAWLARAAERAGNEVPELGPQPFQMASETALADVLRNAPDEAGVMARPQFTRASEGTQPVNVRQRRPDLAAAFDAMQAQRKPEIGGPRGTFGDYAARDAEIQVEAAAERARDEGADSLLAFLGGRREFPTAEEVARAAAAREAGAAEAFRGTPAAETGLAEGLRTPDRLAALRRALGMPEQPMSPGFRDYQAADEAAQAAAEAEWPGRLESIGARERADVGRAETEARGGVAADTALAEGLRQEQAQADQQAARLEGLRGVLGMGRARPIPGFQHVQDVAAELRGAPTGRVLAPVSLADREAIRRIREGFSGEMPAMFGNRNSNADFYDQVRAVSGRVGWTNAEIRAGIDQLADGIDNPQGRAALEVGRRAFPPERPQMTAGFRDYLTADQGVQAGIKAEEEQQHRALAAFLGFGEEPETPFFPHLAGRDVAGPFARVGEAEAAAEAMRAEGRNVRVVTHDRNSHMVVEAEQPDVYTGRVPGEDDLAEPAANPLGKLLGTVREAETVAPREAFEDLITNPNEDALTGLPNRRAFNRRTAQPSADRVFARIDLDNFKALNDLRGHGEGDRALKVVADALRRELRQGDVVARVGGDEFALHVGLEPGSAPNLDALRDKLEGAVQRALEENGLARAGDRNVGASIGFGATEETADAAARARKGSRGVSVPREPIAPEAVTGEVRPAGPVQLAGGEDVGVLPPEAAAAERVRDEALQAQSLVHDLVSPEEAAFMDRAAPALDENPELAAEYWADEHRRLTGRNPEPAHPGGAEPPAVTAEQQRRLIQRARSLRMLEGYEGPTAPENPVGGSEAGFVSARPLLALGGAAVGGIAGGTQGETPEEHAKNAALGALLGAGVGFGGGAAIERAGRKGETALERMLKPQGAEVPAAARAAERQAGVGVETKREFGLSGAAAELARRELPSAKSIPAERLLEARLDKFPAEIRDDLQRVLESPSDPRQGPGFAEQRRHVMPDARVQGLADLIRVDVEKAGPAGHAMNAEEVTAHRNVLASLSVKTAEKAKALLEAGIDVTKKLDVGGLSDAQVVQLLDWTNTNAAREVVFQRLMGSRAEAGRALRAFRMMARTAPGDIQVVRDVLRKGRFDQDLLKLANVWGAIDTQDPAAVYRAMRDVQTRKLSEKVAGYFMGNILSAFKTQERNTFGNMSRLATGIVTKGAAAGPMDAIKSMLTGSERQVYSREAIQDLAGAMHSAGRAWNDFWFTLKNGFSEEWLNTSLDLEGGFAPRPEFKSLLGIPLSEKWLLAHPWNAGARLLDAMDRAFYQLNSGAERYSQAYTTARREATRLKLSGEAFNDFVSKRMVDLRENAPLEMQRSVHEAALEATYREEPGAFGRLIQKMQRETPGVKYVLPFIKTPANIFRQGYEYTPLSGLVKGGKYLAGNKGAWNRVGGGAREATIMQAKAAIGTAASAFFAYLAAQGRLSGSGPTDRATRAQLMATGWRPNSVKMDLPDHVASALGATKSDDGQYWVNYSLFQPLSIPMSLVANGYEAWRDVAQGNVQKTKPQALSEIAAQTVARVAKSGLNQSYLQGLFTFADAINNGQMSAEKFLEQVVTGFVPMSGMLRNIAQTTDPVIRDPNGVVESVKAIVPGLSNRVSPKLGRYGEPIERSGTALRRLLGVPEVEPTTSDWIDKELNRLGVDVGTPSDRLTLPEWFQGGDRQMTEAESLAIREARGRATRARLALLMAAPGYQRLPDWARAQMIRRAISGGAATVAAGGRAALMLQRPDLLEALMLPFNEIAARSYAPGERKGT